jgi:hypothetical protein
MKFEKTKSAMKKIKYARASLKKDGLVALTESFDEFFAMFPEVTMLQWEQYIPSFNDGDALEFSMSDIRLLLNKESVESIFGTKLTDQEYKKRVKELKDSDDGDLYELSKSNNDRALEITKDFATFSGDLLDVPLLEDVFGTPFRITAIPGKFKKEHYDHDW